MASLLRRVWRYAGTAGRMKSSETIGDAKVLLTEAITDAQDQHRKLKTQAAKVLSNQRQTETRLNRALDELEKITRTATQAVLLADQSQKTGDTLKFDEYSRVAENLANRMVGLDSEIETLRELHLQTSQAADQARAAVERDAIALRKKLNERQKLLSQLDQAAMQEEINSALAQLSADATHATPSLDEVRKSIEQRYAKAVGAASVAESGIEAQSLEIERAAMEAQAKARLDKLRAQLDIKKNSED